MLMRYCEICHLPIANDHKGRYAQRRFCSLQCFGKSRVHPSIKPNTGRKYAQGLFAASECSVCGVTHSLERHHRDENPANNEPSNVQIVCKTCHKNIHVANGTWGTGPAPMSKCAVCGKDFLAQCHRKRAKICSPQCLKEWGSLCALKRWKTESDCFEDLATPSHQPSPRSSSKRLEKQ